MDNNKPRTINHRNLIRLFFIAIYVFHIWHNWQDKGVPGLMADSPVYLLMAEFFKSLASGEVSFKFILDFSVFPPLYPILLAAVGTSTEYTAPGHLLNALLLATSCFILFQILQSQTRNIPETVIVIILFAFAPFTLSHSTALLSEQLYLFLSLLSIKLILDHKTSITSNLLISVCIGLLIVTRTIGVALLIAWLINLILDRRKSALYLIPLTFVPYGFWIVFRHFIEATSWYSYSEKYYQHLSSLVAEPSLILEKLLAIYYGWVNLVQYDPVADSNILTMLSFTLVSLGYFKRLQKLKIDATYTTIYLTAILLWPYPDHYDRFLYALFPILLFYGLLGTEILVKKTRTVTDHGLRTLFLYFPLFATMILLGAYLHLDRLLSFPEQLPEEFKKTRVWINSPTFEQGLINVNTYSKLIEVYRQIGRTLDPDQCLYTSSPEIMMMYSHRLSLLPGSQLRNNVQNRDQECRYIYINWINSSPYFPPGYPLNLDRSKVNTIFSVSHGKDGKFGELLEYR